MAFGIGRDGVTWMLDSPPVRSGERIVGNLFAVRQGVLPLVLLLQEVGPQRCIGPTRLLRVLFGGFELPGML